MNLFKILWYNWLIAIEKSHININAEKYFAGTMSYRVYKELKKEHTLHIDVYKRKINNLKI